MNFNENLKYLRKKEKLTQEELAEKLNVSRQAVTKWESGQALPDIMNLKEIADLFGTTTDELLGNERSTKSTSLNKKLKDLPILLFGYGIALISILMQMEFNEFELILACFVIIIPLTTIVLKIYFKSRPKVINLNRTKEGKIARIKYILNSMVIYLTIYLIPHLTIYIVRTMKNLEIHQSLNNIFLDTLQYLIFVSAIEIGSIMYEMKKYNK